jgi:hypothetical protein
MRNITFYEEVTDQIGIFLALVIGFVVAQAWNRSVYDSVSLHKNKTNEDWFDWVYTLIATLVGLTILIIWGYFVASRLFRPSEELQKLRQELRIQTQAM